VFDVFLLPLFLRALVASARRRFGAGLVSASAALLLWGLLVAAGWLGRGADVTGGLMILIFVGPSATPGPTARVPASALLAAHPIGAKLALSGLLTLGFAAAWIGAGRFSPLSDEASTRKKLGLAFLMPALLVLVQAICLGLTEALAAHVGS
jgi:hypothetical protein